MTSRRGAPRLTVVLAPGDLVAMRRRMDAAERLRLQAARARIGWQPRRQRPRQTQRPMASG